MELSRTLDLEMNELAQRLAAGIRARVVPGLLDVVPALGGVALHFDPAFGGSIVDAASLIVSETKKLPDADDLGREVELPVCYEGEFAPDLEEVSKRTGLEKTQIQKLHAAGEHRVLMIGFAPGHAYIGGLHAKLAVPRRASPRAQVPAGSVAIANLQSVVYPYTISGGWSVIGRTPLTIFDAARSRPSLFGPGDRVRFVPIDQKQYQEISERQ